MIAKPDIEMFEEITKTYRQIESELEREKVRLEFFSKSTMSRLYDLFQKSSEVREVVYTLDVDDIIPIVEARILALTKALNGLKVPRLNSCTTHNE